ncbi:MAG TPA: GNAT family N-acetyltransferase [Anaerolineales bacterium]|nr:GNAT family N-acetyltransferase [Anaerolineales bacterium]
MTVTTYKLDASHLHLFNQFDRTFSVSSKVLLDMTGGRLTWGIIPIEPYEKEIPIDEVDPATFIHSEDKAVFLAEVNGKLAGQIKLITWWNGYAYIDDVIVNPQFRGQGVGKALMEAAIQWSREKRFPGIMLETQDDNVAACKLYDSCGFVLGGFDQYTLKNFKPNETALFWYLIF